MAPTEHRTTAAIACALVCGSICVESVWAEDPFVVQPTDLSEFSGNPGFGYSVDVSEDRMIAGMLASGAYIYARTGRTWTLEKRIPLPDSVGLKNGFGRHVALSGNTAVVGADEFDGDEVDSGAVFVYVSDGADWALQQVLSSGNDTLLQAFGDRLALSGDTLVVSAGARQGIEGAAPRAMIFGRDGSTWSLEASIECPHTITAVACDGDTVALAFIAESGNPDTNIPIRVYRRSGATWSLEAEFPSPAESTNDLIGFDLGLDGDTLVVGVGRALVNGVQSGAAFVYARSGADWAMQDVLLPQNGESGDHFGDSVKVVGNYVVAAAPYDIVDGKAFAGTAHVFERAGGGWTLRDSFLPPPSVEVFFGWDTAIQSDEVFVSSPLVKNATEDIIGAVFSYDIRDCPADLTADQSVEGADLQQLLLEWGGHASFADLNRDNAVDGADLAILLAGWGMCP